MSDQVMQRQLSRRQALMLALVFQPGRDFAVIGDQILLDLSGDETALADQVLAAFGPALDSMDEAVLLGLVKTRLKLSGDPFSALFG